MKRQTLSITAMALIFMYLPLVFWFEVCLHVIWGGAMMPLPATQLRLFFNIFLALLFLFFTGLITVKYPLWKKLNILFITSFILVGELAQYLYVHSLISGYK